MNSSGIYISGGKPTVRYSCVYGNTSFNYSGMADPTGTSGNISVDPKLADTSYGNCHILPDSPCIDAGDDAAVQPGWSDIDGQARQLGAHVDIGADESDGTVWPQGPYIVVRVSPSGSDANDGSSWPLAKRTVQAAINAAALVGGDVWVMAGTYQGCISLPAFAHLYGGFVGTETQRSARDWSANRTILDDNKAGDVVTATGGGICSTIDGFVIRNGGSGIYCNSSSPTISNNTISGNSTRYGGGIYCSASSPTITNNTITGNSASDSYGGDGGGGGIYCSSSSCPTISNNTISGNSASSRRRDLLLLLLPNDHQQRD